MITALIWRGKMSRNKYSVKRDDEKSVSICYCTDSCNYLNSFLTIWCDDNTSNINSPFENIDDAEIFAEIIVKLLKVVSK